MHVDKLNGPLSIRLNLERMPNQAGVRLGSIGIHLICNAGDSVAQVGDAPQALGDLSRLHSTYSPLLKTPRRAVPPSSLAPDEPGVRQANKSPTRGS